MFLIKSNESILLTSPEIELFLNAFLIPGHKSPIVYLSSALRCIEISNETLNFWQIISNVTPQAAAINRELFDCKAFFIMSSFNSWLRLTMVGPFMKFQREILNSLN